MLIPDILGWIGNIILCIGLILIGNKNHKGFYACMISATFYLIQAILLGMTSLIGLEFMTFILYIRGLVKWKKEKKI